jgi:hypothetical protein
MTIESEGMRESTSPGGVGGERMKAMVSRDSALMDLRGNREVIPVTMMVGDIDTLVGTGVASAAEADQERIDGGESLVIISVVAKTYGVSRDCKDSTDAYLDS